MKYVLYSIIIVFLLSCDIHEFSNPVDIENFINAPTRLNIQQLTITSAKMTWIDNSSNEFGFKIDRKENNGSWQISYVTTPSNVIEFTDTELNAASKYYYRIYAYADENVSSAIESQLEITFQAPTDLEIILKTLTSCKLTWDYSPVGCEEGLKIQRRLYNGTWLEIAQINANEKEYIDTGLLEGETYEYKVYAYNSEFEGNHIIGIVDMVIKPDGFVFVKGGTVQMGDRFNEGESDELPLHDVTIDNFYLAETEVTHQQVIDVYNWAYEQNLINCLSYTVTNTQGISQELLDLDDTDCAIVWNGSSLVFDGSNCAGSSDCPCIEISWFGSVAFCNYKSLLDSLTQFYDLGDWSCNWNANGYRLPTEAEWEYAARGGNDGDNHNYRYSGCHDLINLPDYAWFASNSDFQTHEIGTKLPNQSGLYDMSGNVQEWCWDWYSSNYYNSSSSNNPTGPISETFRLVRGGSWSIDAGVGSCRVASRNTYGPYGHNHHTGFRILRDFPN